MKKIDRETVSKILDAADIVEVVSDFVTLKRRGANFIGLCPFHSERTPSFSVSKSKGICKCFSCGKGGSPVNFLMELEQMSYQEALRWLAKKYNIPIKEHEESEAEKQQASLRESLFAINSFALHHFENNLHNSADGREIGLTYFHERALTDETIKKFHLGYALDRADALYSDAVLNGYSLENLLNTGLCAKSDRGVYDRFRGRVIYPVHSISGKIVAFGGRTLKSDKTIAKYVNSPESEIYSKSRELYGLFQARRAIVNEDKCILVEGYMDVLSMSQSGIENVVASSGTSLTSQQVNQIHRFTDNVTIIYDADAAGIKASLRGVDMLLSEGMNVKIVLFPEGEDPDSYARTHTKEELAEYLMTNETDFIKFKTSVLLNDAENDPIKRSQGVADILTSIAKIPDAITRQVYIEESARSFGMDAKILSLEVAKRVAKNAEKKIIQHQQETVRTSPDFEDDNQPETSVEKKTNSKPSNLEQSNLNNPLLKFEKTVIRYIIRYGMMILSDAYDDDGNKSPITVWDYILYELNQDNVIFSDPIIALLYEKIKCKVSDWDKFLPNLKSELETMRQELKQKGLEDIRANATSISYILKSEQTLDEKIEIDLLEYEKDLRRKFLQKEFLSDPDSRIRTLVTDLISEKHQLSKVHSKFYKIETEEDKLTELVPRAIFELKDAILRLQIEELNSKIREANNNPVITEKLFAELMEKMRVRSEFAKYLGDRIITPLIN